jgi:CRP-like cAMP-binding protein
MLKKLFKRTYSAKEQNNIDQISPYWLFEGCSNDELYSLLPYIYKRVYNRDEVIFFQNDPSQSVYFLEKGEVKLFLEINKNEERLTNLTKNSTFGENAVFDDSKRNYSAQVISDNAEILMIPHISLENMFEANPKLKGKIFYNVAHNFYSFSRKLVHNYTKDLGFFEIKTVFEDEDF